MLFYFTGRTEALSCGDLSSAQGSDNRLIGFFDYFKDDSANACDDRVVVEFFTVVENSTATLK